MFEPAFSDANSQFPIVVLNLLELASCGKTSGRWDEPRGPRWVKVGQAQEDEATGVDLGGSILM
jgi:hypothetical protein